MSRMYVNDDDFGFLRPTFRHQTLVGSVPLYERHVFLCYKNPESWLPTFEDPKTDPLPRLLSAALEAKKTEMKRKTRLTICGGQDDTESETSNGDVLIFPDMIRYRNLSDSDVETFVKEVLVNDMKWLAGNPEILGGSYFAFICSHGSRDRRSGVCGPPLVARFGKEIERFSLEGKVSAIPCAHIPGHEYAGNTIIFGRTGGACSGHWYGYVAPEDVPELIEQHILKGEIVDRLWRGQMGLSEEDQKKSQEERFSRSAKGEESVKSESSSILLEIGKILFLLQLTLLMYFICLGAASVEGARLLWRIRRR